MPSRKDPESADAGFERPAKPAPELLAEIAERIEELKQSLLAETRAAAEQLVDKLKEAQQLALSGPNKSP